MFRFEIWLEEEGGEGDEGADEDKGGAFDGPFPHHHGNAEKNDKNRKDSPMNSARNTDGGFVSEDHFFIQGEVEEDDEREAIEEREEAEEAERILEHGLGRAFLGEHEFVAFGVEAEGEVDESVLFFGFTHEAAAVF